MVSRVHIERRRAGGFPEPWRWSISGLESLLRGREETAKLACVWVSGWTRVLCPELPGQRGAGRPPTIWPGNCGLESLPSGLCACACPPRPGLGARCGRMGGRAQSEGARKREARPRVWGPQVGDEVTALLTGPRDEHGGSRRLGPR